MFGDDTFKSFHLGLADKRRRMKHIQPRTGLPFAKDYWKIFESHQEGPITVCTKVSEASQPKALQSLYALRSYTSKSPAHRNIEAVIRCLNNDKGLMGPGSCRDNILEICDFFHDLDSELCWVVSKHAPLSLRQLIDGVTSDPHMICHDDIGWIMKSTVDGLRFLASHELQHNAISADHILIMKDGVVKVGGLQHISALNSHGSMLTRHGLIELASGMVFDESPGCHYCRGPGGRCLQCQPKLSFSDFCAGEFYCQGKSMRRLVKELDRVLEKHAIEMLEEVKEKKDQMMRILDAVGMVPLIQDATGPQLSGIVWFSVSKVYLGIQPSDKPKNPRNILAPAAAARKKRRRRELSKPGVRKNRRCLPKVTSGMVKNGG